MTPPPAATVAVIIERLENVIKRLDAIEGKIDALSTVQATLKTDQTVGKSEVDRAHKRLDKLEGAAWAIGLPLIVAAILGIWSLITHGGLTLP